MRLRDYQNRAAESTLEAWKEGARAVAGRMFTGGGKTVVFADLIRRRLPARAMVLAHRRELIWQARDKIQRVTQLEVGVEMGEFKASVDKNLLKPRDQIIVSTVQTHVSGGDGAGRLGKFDPMDFGLLIIDECHRAIAPSYKRVIQHYLSNPDLVVLGVTATPDRADEKALGQVFESVPAEFDYDINYGRSHGWLAEVYQQSVHVESLDFSAVRVSADDLNNSDLAAVMEAEKPLYGLADATLTIAGDKKGIGFSPSVAHAQMTANIFNRHKPGCAAFVHGGTDAHERTRINADFASGKIRWIWNCGTHTEGFDDAGIEVVVPKPTKSRSLYEQMIGRGTRPHDSLAVRLGTIASASLRRQMVRHSKKPSCLVLDFYGNSGKHKLITAFDVLSGDMSDEAIEEAIAETRAKGSAVRVAATLEEQELRLEEKRRRETEEAERKAKLKVKAKWSTQAVDPFDVLDVRPVRARGWDEGKALSEKQRNVLRKGGVNPDGMEYAQAKQLVSVIIDRWTTNRCSIPQAALMERLGWSKAEASAMSFSEARAAIDAAKSNGWRKPASWSPPAKPAELKSEDVPF